MEIEESFLTSIETNPASDADRLVYADWLDDHDQTEKARFLRLGCDLASLYPSFRDTRYAELKSEMASLSQTIDADWQLRVARFTLVLKYYPPEYSIEAIRFIRQLTGIRLGAAKQVHLTRPTPIPLLRFHLKEQADEFLLTRIEEERIVAQIDLKVVADGLPCLRDPGSATPHSDFAWQLPVLYLSYESDSTR